MTIGDHVHLGSADRLLSTLFSYDFTDVFHFHPCVIFVNTVLFSDSPCAASRQTCQALHAASSSP